MCQRQRRACHLQGDNLSKQIHVYLSVSTLSVYVLFTFEPKHSLEWKKSRFPPPLQVSKCKQKIKHLRGFRIANDKKYTRMTTLRNSARCPEYIRMDKRCQFYQLLITVRNFFFVRVNFNEMSIKKSSIFPLYRFQLYFFDMYLYFV